MLLPGIHLKCKDEKKTCLLFLYQKVAERIDNILGFTKKSFFPLASTPFSFVFLSDIMRLFKPISLELIPLLLRQLQLYVPIFYYTQKLSAC